MKTRERLTVLTSSSPPRRGVNLHRIYEFLVRRRQRRGRVLDVYEKNVKAGRSFPACFDRDGVLELRDTWPNTSRQEVHLEVGRLQTFGWTAI